MNLTLKRILAGCLALVAAVAGSSIPLPPAGSAATCERLVAIQPEVSTGEAAGGLPFAVRSSGCPAAGGVAYTVEAGTAQPAADFLLPGGLLQWAAGDTGARAVTATVVNDLALEADIEDFRVRLTDPSPGIRITGATGRGRILDDDGPAALWVVDGNICRPTPPDFPGCSCDVGYDNIDCPPGGHLNSRLSAPVTVHWSTMDGTARAGIDFVGVADQVVTVPAGTTRFELPVRFLPAGTPGGSFYVRIFAPSAGRVVDELAVIVIEAP